MKQNEFSSLFEPWRTKHCRTAWRPVVDNSNKESYSWYGGDPSMLDASQWPSCSECRQPMQFFLQLDLAELPESLNTPKPYGLLQFFCCVNDQANCETWEPFSGTHTEWIIYGSQKNETRPNDLRPFPKSIISQWDALDDFPHPEDHKALGVQYAYDFDNNFVSVKCADPPLELVNLNIDIGPAELVSEAASGDKLAGWPNWVQGAEYPVCPECGTQMEALLQIESQDNLPHMFGDLGCGHITQCAVHPNVLAFGWACS